MEGVATLLSQWFPDRVRQTDRSNLTMARAKGNS